MMPRWSGSMRETTAPIRSISAKHVSTDMCSIELTIQWVSCRRTPRSCRPRANPIIERLLASVRPEVNMMPRALHPSNPAMCARASSSARFAATPSLWIAPGFPMSVSGFPHGVQRGGQNGGCACVVEIDSFLPE